jgi:predicted aspartyl protease
VGEYLHRPRVPRLGVNVTIWINDFLNDVINIEGAVIFGEMAIAPSATRYDQRASLQEVPMISTATEKMGKVTTTITVTNQVDQILASRGFIPDSQVRSLTLENVLVDTGATRLCLPANVIAQLGLVLQSEVEVKTAVGIRKAKLFKEVILEIAGRQGVYNCMELPGGEDPLLGVIPLEDLGLEPDLQTQTLRVLPTEGKDTYLTIL